MSGRCSTVFPIFHFCGAQPLQVNLPAHLKTPAGRADRRPSVNQSGFNQVQRLRYNKQGRGPLPAGPLNSTVCVFGKRSLEDEITRHVF